MELQLKAMSRRLLAGPVFVALAFVSGTIGLVVWHHERKLARQARRQGR
jgi:hypothetical protein